jgi:hypothetical protein
VHFVGPGEAGLDVQHLLEQFHGPAQTNEQSTLSDHVISHACIINNSRWTDVRLDRHETERERERERRMGWEIGRRCYGAVVLARREHASNARPHNGERRAAVEIASDSAD